VNDDAVNVPSAIEQLAVPAATTPPLNVHVVSVGENPEPDTATVKGGEAGPEDGLRVMD
jgi:predicted secreted protein